MKSLRFFLIISLLICTRTANAQKEISKQPLAIGEQLEVRSLILQEKRKINIYLPNGYDKDAAKHYPVIYLLDGSMNEDFIHISGIVQFGSFSWIDMLPESIVVGISNVDRKRDFTYPSSFELDQKEFPTSGKSARFIQFIESELQPLIDTMYKVSGERTLIGQSLGGLLATEVLFKKPELFDNYIIVSPSLWWDSEQLQKMTPALHDSPKQVYIAVGKEGAVMERVAMDLYKHLGAQKVKNKKLFYQHLDKQRHGDALHLAVYDAFEKLFRKSK